MKPTHFLAASLMLAACNPTTQKVPLYAPERFDHSYPGPVEVRLVLDDNAWADCSANGKTNLPKNTVACAAVQGETCVIYMALLAEGLDWEAVQRHEEAHCNGWPADHPA